MDCELRRQDAITEEISVTSASGGRGRWSVWPSHLIEKVSEREQVGRGNGNSSPHDALRIVCATSKHGSDVWPNLCEGEIRKGTSYLHVEWPITKYLCHVIRVRKL